LTPLLLLLLSQGVVETPIELFERTGQFWNDPARKDL
jgi:hypothetical protein